MLALGLRFLTQGLQSDSYTQLSPPVPLTSDPRLLRSILFPSISRTSLLKLSDLFRRIKFPSLFFLMNIGRKVWDPDAWWDFEAGKVSDSIFSDCPGQM